MRQSAASCLLCCAAAALPAAAQVPGTWRLETELRIGSIDRPNYNLTSINDLEIGPSGEIFVSQPSDRVVRVYDASGTFVREIGRDGSGPGEFRRIDALGTAGDGVVVLDRRLQRLSRFDWRGVYKSQWGIPRIQLGGRLTAVAPLGVFKDGSLLLVPNYEAEPGDTQRRVPIIQLSNNGTFRRSLAQIDLTGQTRRAEAGTLRGVIPQAVGSHTLWSMLWDRAGVILVHRVTPTSSRAGEFHLVRVGLTGDTTLNRRYRVAGRTIPRAVAVRVREELIDNAVRDRPIPRAQVASLYANGWDIPEYQASIERLLVSDDGSLWLQEGAFGLSSAVWRVYDSNGDLMGSVQVPTRLTLHRVSKHQVWGVEKGEFDESYVVRFRIVR